MKTRTLGPRVIALFLVAVSFLFWCASQESHAQTRQPGGASQQPPSLRPVYPRVSPDQVYDAAKSLELTYTNSIYGLSFRFPSIFVFQELSLSDSVFASGSQPHADPGGMTLASVLMPRNVWMGAGGSAPRLLVGVNPKASQESCMSLVAPDQSTTAGVLKLAVNSAELTGRNEMHNHPRFAVQTSYERQYVAYSNGICYEFEIAAATLDPSHVRSPYRNYPVSVNLDGVFAEMESIVRTVQLQSPNPAAAALGKKAVSITKPWETSLTFPKELAALGDLADWTIQYPTGGPPTLPPPVRPTSYKICGEADSGRYLPVTFMAGASTDLDGAAANAAMDKLNSDVIQLLQRIGWKLMNSSPGGPASTCYGKDGVYVTTGIRGTDRCTANSPCGVSDILTVIVDIPASAQSGTP